MKEGNNLDSIIRVHENEAYITSFLFKFFFIVPALDAHNEGNTAGPFKLPSCLPFFLFAN